MGIEYSEMNSEPLRSVWWYGGFSNSYDIFLGYYTVLLALTISAN